MSKPSSGSGKAPPDPRKARLARALRDNLRRRKEQARDRKEADSPETAKAAGEKVENDRRR